MSGHKTAHGAIFVCAALTAANGCKAEPDPFEEAADDVMGRYADLAYFAHREAAAAVSLDPTDDVETVADAIEGFFALPSAQTYNFIKVRWGVARDPWGRADAFVIPTSPSEELYAHLNLSNLNQGFLDYTTTDTLGGLVNATDTYPTIDKELLVDLNQLGGPSDVTLGFHAIEFLLWGQDLREEDDGKREYTDYLTTPEGTADHQDRRRTFLSLATELLAEDLAGVRDQWQRESGPFRATFLDLDTTEQMRLALTGLYRLSHDEMQRLRLADPLQSQQRDGDHCPFSDLSHDDLYWSAVGVRDAYADRVLPGDAMGREPQGISRLVEMKSPALDQEMHDRLAATIAAMDALRNGEDLEHAILAAVGSAERAAADAALQAVEEQSATLEKVANLFGFSLEQGGDDDGTETGDGSGSGTTSGTTDTGTDSSSTTTDSSGTDESGTVFLPNPDMG